MRAGAPVIRVLVVEDSASTRALLVRLLQADGGFEVVGTAADGEGAVALAARLVPDVITMDLHLPRLDGVAATRRIMAETPTPIVVISAHVAQKEVGLAFEALQAGAVTVVDKPPGPGHPRHAAAVHDLLTTIRLMAEVKVVRRRSVNRPEIGVNARSKVAPTPPLHAINPAGAIGCTQSDGRRPLALALAASTGGPQAIQHVLQALGGNLDVPVLAVQHIGPGFAAGMAAWLSATCRQTVRLAEYGESPVGGTVYLAPDDRHLLVGQTGRLVLSKAPPVGGFRPSASLFFESVAEYYGPRAIGIILTGMGDDGVAGLGKLRAAGAPTFAQDEATSVVYGMPQAAVAAGAVEQVLPLSAIGPAVRRLLRLPDRPAADVDV